MTILPISESAREIRRLRQKITDLERALFEDFVPPAWFPLPRCELLALSALLKRTIMSREALFIALYSDRHDPPEDYNAVESHVSKLRKKLKETFGVDIKSRRFQGYWIEPEGKERIRAMCEAEKQRELA